VTRACYDWQVYDPQRAEKGGARWHTLEGPFVLKRKGIYYQMFSGGNWRNDTYGVAYATAESLETQDEWAQTCDGTAVLPILRSVPGQVIGPGHNSVIRGPDNRQLYCVYHRWGKDNDDSDGRLLAIDPLDWAGERMLILGPSWQPQSAPLLPTFADFIAGENRTDVARVGNPRHKEQPPETVEATYDVTIPFFLAELSLRAVTNPSMGKLGVRLEGDGKPTLSFSLRPDQNQLLIHWQSTKGQQEQVVPLPTGFNFHAYHLLRLEVDGRRIVAALDGTTARWQGTVTAKPTQITLFAEQTDAAFAGFSVTLGWQDLFTADVTPAELGWISDDLESWQVRDRQLTFTHHTEEGMAWKGPFLESYELVANARLAVPDGAFGFFPAMTADDTGPLLTVEPDESGWMLHWDDEIVSKHFPLPAHFDPTIYQQFRFRKESGQLAFAWENHQLGKASVTAAPTRIGLYGRHAAAFDMVRVTAAKK
jgi:hypothetical protein